MKQRKYEADQKVREQMGDWLLTDTEVAQVLQVSRAHWWKGVKQGRYPQPIRLGRCTRWLHSSVAAVMKGEV